MNPAAITRLNAALQGRYRIERELGEGGMATVYLARDERHDRKVALKVLKPELAAIMGADRFLAEIRTTANLQHPHILPLFDSGEADGFLFYVMPYVAGESLRDRLGREGELPVKEAVRIATTVAGALDYAHRQGVVHRDVKPANILLHDGEPLVADFGIALAVSAAGGGRLTETGLSLGTPYYMSPEQATAERDPDARSDVYALGCVLYEMLVGEPPYTGSSAQAVLGKVLTTDPVRPTEHRRTVPAHVEATVLKALEKRPADRFGSAAELAAALADPQFGIRTQESAAGVEASAGPRSGLRSVAVGLAAGLALGALGYGLLGPGRATSGQTSLSLNLELPDAAPLVFVGEASFSVGLPALAISPDGSTLVYVGPSGPTTRLFRRRLDTDEVVPLPGTEGAYAPFFSPDGSRLAFMADDRVKITPTGGGDVTIVVDAPDGHVGGWSDDDLIGVTVRNGSALVTVRPSGLEERTLAIPDLGMRTMQWLPDSDWIVRDCLVTRICAMSSVDGETRFLTVGGAAAATPTEGVPLLGTQPQVTTNGFLVYSAHGENVTRAIRFDPRTLATSGEPVDVLHGLRREAFTSIQHVAISRAGTLVYARGIDASRGEFVWVDGAGQEEPLPFPPRVFGAFALSPDGARIAAPVLTEAGPQRLEILDLESGRLRVWSGPSDEAVTQASWWDPTSESVYVTSTVDPMRTIRIDVDAPSGGDVLYEGTRPLVVEGRLPDGRLVVDEFGQGLHLIDEATLRAWDDGASPTTPDFLAEAFIGAVSPGGAWLTYTSGVSGRFEVYAVRLPLGEEPRPVQVSSDGGESAAWAPDGSGVYYRDGRRWYRVELTQDPRRPFGLPQPFVEGPYLNLGGAEHAVSTDGERLLVVRGLGPPTTTTLHVVTGWLAALEARASR